MPNQARSTFEVKSWQEPTLSEGPDGAAKITHASVVFAYSGDLEGQSAMEYLMVYGQDGSATVIGVERFSGTLKGNNGTFVLQHHGSYGDGVAKGDFEVVEGSATGALSGLRGNGTAIARKDGSTEFSLDYTGVA